MAGHSKWANIQHRKGRQDVKRGKVFTKLIKEITVSAKAAGGDACTAAPIPQHGSRCGERWYRPLGVVSAAPVTLAVTHPYERSRSRFRT